MAGLACAATAMALLAFGAGSLVLQGDGTKAPPAQGAAEPGGPPSAPVEVLSQTSSASSTSQTAPAGEEPEPPVSHPDIPAPIGSESQPEAAVSFTSWGPEEPVEDYVDWLVQQTLAEIQHPGMTEYEKAKAAYDYILDNIMCEYEICPELWRIYQEDRNTPIPYLENRALTVLRYHVGMCEDQAAALVLLLRGMGLEAEYLPGFYLLWTGEEAMDHAWAQVKVDGIWYHIDPEREMYKARRGDLRYRFFLKGDEEMRLKYLWGENSLDSGRLTASQREEVRRSWMGKPCPQNYPVPPKARTCARTRLDLARLKREAAAEIAAWEAEHGALAPIQLNLEPPVFGFEGYGPVLALE